MYDANTDRYTPNTNSRYQYIACITKPIGTQIINKMSLSFMSLLLLFAANLHIKFTFDSLYHVYFMCKFCLIYTLYILKMLVYLRCLFVL